MASISGVSVIGLGVMMMSTDFSSRSGVSKRCRRRSPSVRMPISFLRVSITATEPDLAAVMARMASRTGCPLSMAAKLSWVRMMSRTDRRRVRPMAPPGWR